MKFILGIKKDMTQIFNEENGTMVPVTTVEAGPCFVSQIKKHDSDTHAAVQIAFGKRRKVNKPNAGHVKDIGADKYLREFRVEDDAAAEKFVTGDTITCSQFKVGDSVSVVGTSKGKGFQGVVKRHGFAGSPKSHGHKDQHRMPGSIGATDPGRVFKGMRMAGHMGDDRVTVKNLEVVKVDPDTNTLFIKGAVPGYRGGLVLITAIGEMTKVESKKGGQTTEASEKIGSTEEESKK